MRPAVFARVLARESRGSRGRLVFFVGCLAVGVAAVVAVAGLSASLDRTIRGEARQLLAADLVVQSRRPLSPEILAAIAAIPGSERTDVKEMVTVVAAPGSAGAGSSPSPVTGNPGVEPPASPDAEGGSSALAPDPRSFPTQNPLASTNEPAPGRSQLVELKVLNGRYPFYGRLQLDPPRPLAELLTADTAIVGPDLLARLGLRIGDELRVGGALFRIAATVLAEPDRMGGAWSVGPRVFLAAGGLERTVLEGRGSRVSYRALVRLPDGTTAEGTKAAATQLETAIPATSGASVESYTEAQPTLRQGLARAERFLGLVALLSLLIGGVGVAQTVRAWLAGRLDAIAILKALGVRPREVLWIYLGQTAVLGLLGSLVGIVLGTAVQWTVPALLGDLLPAGLQSRVEPSALGRGLVLGVAVALLFSVPPLLAALRVPPVRVLRRDAEPLPFGRLAATLVALAVLGGVFSLAAGQSGSFRLGMEFTIASALATLLLAGAARMLARLVGSVLRRARVANLWLRHGLAALTRPGAGTTGAIVGLGLGVLVVLGMSEVQSHLAEQLDRDLPTAAPSVFMVDIQPDQWAGIQELLRDQSATRVDSVPVVMARLTAVGGKPVEELAGGTKGARNSRRWALTREQRLTYLDRLPDDNRLVAGALWSDPERAEVSLEEEFAGDLGATLGTVLDFDIQGVPLQLTLTSIRSVRWESFGINFYLVVEPGVLESAPQFRLASARLSTAGEQNVQDLIAVRFPNVTLLPIRAVLERITGIMRRIGLGVRFLGGFTVVAGLSILAGAVAAGSARRGREVALWKTLGMTRRGVATVYAIEYALLGFVAGAIGAAGGGVLAWSVLTRGMEIAWRFRPEVYAIALLGTVALSVLAGLAASASALRRRPIEVLRAE